MTDIDLVSAHIRYMRVLTDQDCLQILEAMLAKFDPHCDDGAPGALLDAYQQIDAEIIAHAKQDQAPDDSWQRRQDRAAERAQLADCPAPF